MSLIHKVFCICGREIKVINAGLDDNSNLIITVDKCECALEREEIG